jgi:hypothetical protein
MADPVPDGNRRPVVKREKLNGTRAMRHGGSVTLPEGASEEDIDNALRQPAAEQES